MTASASIARTKAMATSSTPHHLGQVSLFVTKPATTGKTDEMQNTIAVVIASGRPCPRSALKATRSSRVKSFWSAADQTCWSLSKGSASSLSEEAAGIPEERADKLPLNCEGQVDNTTPGA